MKKRKKPCSMKYCRHCMCREGVKNTDWLSEDLYSRCYGEMIGKVDLLVGRRVQRWWKIMLLQLQMMVDFFHLENKLLIVASNNGRIIDGRNSTNGKDFFLIFLVLSCVSMWRWSSYELVHARDGKDTEEWRETNESWRRKPFHNVITK